jgi:ApaG protein
MVYLLLYFISFLDSVSIYKNFSHSLLLVNIFKFEKSSGMVSKVTDGIRISVEQFYQPDYSNPLQLEFMFAYRITIENHNSFPVQLLRRHWFICDSNAEQKEVEGEGVIGVQPVIAPNDQYQYISGCNLKSELGKMYGSYLMENVFTRQQFQVNIPVYFMEAPFKRN